jgi:hypothetical protein
MQMIDVPLQVPSQMLCKNLGELLYNFIIFFYWFYYFIKFFFFCKKKMVVALDKHSRRLFLCLKFYVHAEILHMYVSVQAKPICEIKCICIHTYVSGS